MSNYIGENMDVRIEVEDDHVMIVLPRKMDDFIMPWQQAMAFGDVLEQAAGDIPQKPTVVDPVALELEQRKLALNRWQGCVALIFDHTDRIKLSYEATRVLARAIRMVAQDLCYESKGVFIRYDVKGRKGRPTPFFDGTRFPLVSRTR